MPTDPSSALAPSSREMSAALTADGEVRVPAPVESSPPSLPAKRTPRLKPPKDSKVYKVALSVVALRAQGAKAKDIAETLGYSEDVIRQYVHRAYKRGWISVQSFADPDDALDLIKTKVVGNVDTALTERTVDGGLTAGAREMTLEAAKGLGLFKAHQVVKGDMNASIGVALRVDVVMPPGARQQSTISIRPGTVGGAAGLDIPADAEIVDATVSEV